MQIAATYRVENVAQVLSSKLKFVHAKHHRFACGDKKNSQVKFLMLVASQQHVSQFQKD
jgi:hypothetical protein